MADIFQVLIFSATKHYSKQQNGCFKHLYMYSVFLPRKLLTMVSVCLELENQRKCNVHKICPKLNSDLINWPMTFYDVGSQLSSTSQSLRIQNVNDEDRGFLWFFQTAKRGKIHKTNQISLQQTHNQKRIEVFVWDPSFRFQSQPESVPKSVETKQ